MRIKASAVAMLIVVAALSGCTASPAAAPTATPSASSAPAESAESAGPTPTPTPTGDADDPSAWMITDDGIGPIALGAPFGEALALMPEGTRNDPERCSHTAWWTPTQGSQLYMAATDGGAGAPVALVATESWADPSAAAGLSTEKGIGVGSSVDEVLEAYPDATEVADTISPDIIHLRAGRIFFTYREDPVITSVTVTTFPVPPYELCG